MADQQQDPFAGYSPEDREDIANQLDALQKSGKLNPAQTQGVSRAMGYLRPPKVAAAPPNPSAQQTPEGRAEIARAGDSFMGKALNLPGVDPMLRFAHKALVEPYEGTLPGDPNPHGGAAGFGKEMGANFTDFAAKHPIAATAVGGPIAAPFAGLASSGPEGHGVARAVAEIGGSMAADPRQWPLLGTGKVMRPLLQKGMEAGFATLMGKQATDAATVAGATWDDNTPEGREARYNALTHMIVGSAMAAHVGSGMTREAVTSKGEDFTNKYSDRVRQKVTSRPAPKPATAEEAASQVDEPANGLSVEEKKVAPVAKPSTPKPSRKAAIAADNAELAKAGMAPTEKLTPMPKVKFQPGTAIQGSSPSNMVEQRGMFVQFHMADGRVRQDFIPMDEFLKHLEPSQGAIDKSIQGLDPDNATSKPRRMDFQGTRALIDQQIKTVQAFKKTAPQAQLPKIEQHLQQLTEARNRLTPYLPNVQARQADKAKPTPQATVSAGGTGALSSEEIARGQNGDKHYYIDPNGKITYQGSQPDAPPQTIARGGAVVRYNPRRGWDTVNGDSSLLPKFKRKLDTIQASPAKVEPAERVGLAPKPAPPAPEKVGDAARADSAMDAIKKAQSDIADVDKQIASQTKARGQALKQDQPRIDQELNALTQKKEALKTQLYTAFGEHAKGLSSKEALELHGQLGEEATKNATAQQQISSLLKGDVQAKALRAMLGQMIPKGTRAQIHQMLGDVQLANVYDPKILKFVNSKPLRAEVENTRMIIQEALKDPDLDPKTRKMYENFMAPDKKGNPKAVVFRPKMVKGAIGKDAAGNVSIPGSVPELTTAAGNWLLADGKKLNMSNAELRGRLTKLSSDAATRQAHVEKLQDILGKAHNISDLQARQNLIGLRDGTLEKSKLSAKEIKGLIQRPDLGNAMLGDKWEQARVELSKELASRKPEPAPPVVSAPPTEVKTVVPEKLPSAAYFHESLMSEPAVQQANARIAAMSKESAQANLKKVQSRIDLAGGDASPKDAALRQALQQRLDEFKSKGRQPDAQQVADMSAAKAANRTVEPKVEQVTKPTPKPKKPKAPPAPKPPAPTEASAQPVIDKVNQQARVNEIASLYAQVSEADREPLKAMVNDIVPKGRDRFEAYKLALNAYLDAAKNPQGGTPMTAARGAINKWFLEGGEGGAVPKTPTPTPEPPKDAYGKLDERIKDFEARENEDLDAFKDNHENSEDALSERHQGFMEIEGEKLPFGAEGKFNPEDYATRWVTPEEDVNSLAARRPFESNLLKRAHALAKLTGRPIPADLEFVDWAEKEFFAPEKPLEGSGGAGAAAPDLKQQLKDAGLKDADINRAVDSNPDDPKAAIRSLYRDRVAQQVQAMRLADYTKTVLPNDPDLMVQLKGIIDVAEKNGVSQDEMVAINNELLKPKAQAAAAGANKPTVTTKSFSDLQGMFTPEPKDEPAPTKEAVTPEAAEAALRANDLAKSLPKLGADSILSGVKKLPLSRSAKVHRWERALKIYKEGLSQQDPMALRKALDSIHDSTKLAFGIDPTEYLNVPQTPTFVPELDEIRQQRAARVSKENPGLLARSMAFVRRMPDWAYRTFYEQFPDLKGAVSAVEKETGQPVRGNPYYAAERTSNQILGTISSIGKRYGKVTRAAYKEGLWDATSKIIELRSYEHALSTLDDKVASADNAKATLEKQYQALADSMQKGEVSPKKGARKLASLGAKLRDARKLSKDLADKIDNGEALPGGYTRDQVEDHLNLMQDQLGPEAWDKANAYADQLYAIHREHLVKLHEAGMVSDAAMATFLARGMDHAPQYRYLDAVTKDGQRNGGNLYTSDVDILKPLLGSEKLTKDPVESMMKWDMRAANLIAKNNVAKTFARFGEEFGLATRLKSRADVPAGEVPIPVWETSQEAGEYQEEPDNGTTESDVPPPPGGQRVYYSVPREIADNLAAVNGRQLGALEKVLRAFKIPFQAGATTANLAFALPNALRHAMDYHILAPSGAGINPIEHAKFIGQWADSLLKVIKQDPEYVKDFLPSGAAFSTYQTAITPGAFLRDAASGANPRPTVKSVVMSPIHGTERLINVLEEATKLTAFKRELAKSGSMEEAVHNTLNLGGAPNFRNMGTAGQMMNLLFPFSNAHLRYTGRVLEHIDPRTPQGQSNFIRLAAAVTLSELALAHWNHQFKDEKGNPEYDHVPDQEKQQNWYMLLPSTYQTSDGFIRHNAIKVPKPTAIRLFSNTIGSVIDHGMGGRTSMEQIPADFVSQFMPGQYRIRAEEPGQSVLRGTLASANPAIREPLEQGMNLDAWKNRPIVPKYMEGIEPKYQTNSTVHPSMDAVGAKVGLSPLRLQHGVRSELAGLGETMLDVADKAFPDKPRGDESILEGDERLSRIPVAGVMIRRFRGTPFDQVAQDNEEKFYRMLGRAEQKQTTSGFLEKQNHPDFAGYYTSNALPIEVASAYKEAAKDISDYRALQREVLKSQMAPEAKRTALKGINTAIQTIIDSTNRAYSQYVR